LFLPGISISPVNIPFPSESKQQVELTVTSLRENKSYLMGDAGVGGIIAALKNFDAYLLQVLQSVLKFS
jgi:hypothetical protein